MRNELIRAHELLREGQVEQAARLIDGILRSHPKDADAMVLRAQVSLAQQQLDEAGDWLRRAAKCAPQRGDVQHEVGLAYLRLERVDEAVRRFEVAIRVNATLIAPHYELGRVYLDRLKQPSLAAAAFRRVLELDRDQIEARYHLGKALFQLGDVDEAVTALDKARALAEAAGRDDAVALCLQSIAVAIPGSTSADNAQILAARAAWARTLDSAQQPDAVRESLRWRDRSPDRPLVIGYVSSFFDRENWMKPVWALLNQHDRDQFQVRVFSFGPLPGGENPGSAADSAWRPHDSDRVFDVAGLDNEQLAQVIADEGVDLLVDLNGYSDPGRLALFALRPAPLVVGWFNMYATTGMSHYDYLIGDDHVVRPDEEIHYSERIARVPGSYLTFRVHYPVPEVAAAPVSATGSITFGSLCSRYKITPPVLDAWCAILRRCPSTRLLLRNAGLEQPCERQFLLAQFEQRGIEPERLELLGRAPHFEFLETYGRIDIALDTFPYSGGTTTTEAIWQGVPVVAFVGPTWPSRTSATILREGGLGDWVADDVPGYIELAVRCASGPNASSDLADLRHSLRNRLLSSRVCDTVAFARSMEALYREMWRRRLDV